MKTCLSDLAVFGGAPAFKEKLHVGRPNIGDRERLLERINKFGYKMAIQRRPLRVGV